MRQFSNIIDNIALAGCVACLVFALLDKNPSAGAGWFVALLGYTRIIIYKTT